jgi:hypothetical protein
VKISSKLDWLARTVLWCIDRSKEVAQVVRNILSILFFCMLSVSQAQSADSSLFGFSTDKRLMSKIEKLGELENGLVVYSWQWNKTASELDPRYGIAEVDGGFLSIGFIAQEIGKVYPDAVEIGDSGYLHINEQQLAKADQFIRWKLTSDSRTVSGRCSRINGSRYILCF